MTDDAYTALPLPLRLAIDDAFLSFASTAHSPEKADGIPLPRIPAALARLDIQPDDQVLEVFANAASGWSAPAHASANIGANVHDGEGGVVSKNDFRAVCAVLVDADSSPPPSPPAIMGGGFMLPDDADMEDTGAGFMLPSDDDEGDAYEDEEPYERDPASDSSGSADEYADAPRPSTSRRTRARRRRTPAPPSSRSQSPPPGKRRARRGPKALTAAQHAAALETFALFFPAPAPPGGELAAKRLMIRDLVRVAGVLKEKITAEEVRFPLFPPSSPPPFSALPSPQDPAPLSSSVFVRYDADNDPDVRSLHR